MWLLQVRLEDVHQVVAITRQSKAGATRLSSVASRDAAQASVSQAQLTSVTAHEMLCDATNPSDTHKSVAASAIAFRTIAGLRWLLQRSTDNR